MSRAGFIFQGSVQRQSVSSDFCLVFGGWWVPLGSKKTTIPSAVPEDPVVTSSVPTPTQQNLQPDTASTCKFGLSHTHLQNQNRNATDNSVTFHITNKHVP